MKRVIENTNAFTIFIKPPTGRTIPLRMSPILSIFCADMLLFLVVTPSTTMADLLVTLHHRKVFPLQHQQITGLRMVGRFRSLDTFQTMEEIGASPLSHFVISCRLLGGSNNAG